MVFLDELVGTAAYCRVVSAARTLQLLPPSHINFSIPVKASVKRGRRPVLDGFEPPILLRHFPSGICVAVCVYPSESA